MSITHALTQVVFRRAIILAGIFSFALASGALAADETQSAKLTNDGVKALHALNFALAVQNLEQAVKLDPKNQIAKENLVAAYNNYALELKNNVDLALTQLHQAAYLDPTSTATQENLLRVIKQKRRDPSSFNDRIALALACKKNGDFAGSIVEYRCALQLKDDVSTHIALGDVESELGQNSEAIEEYKKAILLPEMKLAALYASNHQIADASAVFNQVLTANPSDKQARDAFIAAWSSVKDGQANDATAGAATGVNLQDKRQHAVWELSKCLKLDKMGFADRTKLAKEHIDCGWKISNYPIEALKEFHRALVLDPAQRVTTTSMDNAIRLMGREPGRFDDRLTLAERAYQDADWIGAGIEYIEALSIKEDAPTRIKLGDLFLKIGSENDAAEQYKKASVTTLDHTVSASN